MLAKWPKEDIKRDFENSGQIVQQKQTPVPTAEHLNPRLMARLPVEHMQSLDSKELFQHNVVAFRIFVCILRWSILKKFSVFANCYLAQSHSKQDWGAGSSVSPDAVWATCRAGLQ